MSAKFSCQTVAALLRSHGVTDVVISPGSRNVPLIQAVDEEGLDTRVVVDERCAAFMALGMAQTSGRPVAVVCTSGTALLNYAPAVAEACYQHIPLVVISADRPRQWIDQDDSQTIRQPGALANFVKYGCDLPDFSDPEGEMAWYARRCVNDALIAASAPAPGPVHINVQLSEPLLADFPRLEASAPVRCLRSADVLAGADIKELASILAHKKVMVVAGFMPPSDVMNRGIQLMASLPNVVVLAETTSNVRARGIFPCVDRILTLVRGREDYFAPDVVITVGGPLVSRHLKTFMRERKGLEHWSVSFSQTSADVFKHLSLRIQASPDRFILSLADALVHHDISGGYAAAWQALRDADVARHEALVSAAPWSSLRAFSVIWPSLPQRANVQLSNGTCVRYAQLFDNPALHSCCCNRGVSGIDGCTSTAVGASLAYAGPTILITGDMCFSYDAGALALPAPPEFKIIVMNNGGGGIFRFIKGTRNFAEREKYLCADPHVKARELCGAYVYEYFRADGEDALREVLPRFFGLPSRAVLEIAVDPELDARAINDYFKTS